MSLSRYFFDIHEDHQLMKDEEGVVLSSLEEVRAEAKRILPNLAAEALPQDGDRKTYVVLVRAEDNTPVYSATLAFAGLWLCLDRTINDTDSESREPADRQS